MSTNVKQSVSELVKIINQFPANMSEILDYVRKHIEDPHVCERGVQAAWNLMFYDAAEKKRALDASILELCKETLVLHARHKEVGRPIVRNALFIFKEMANVCESTSAKIKLTHKKNIFDKCMEMGLSVVIIDHMKLYCGKVGGFVLDFKIQEAGAAVPSGQESRQEAAADPGAAGALRESSGGLHIGIYIYIYSYIFA